MSATLPGDAALLAAWIERSHELVAATDREGRLVSVNRNFVMRLGTADGLLGELAPAGADGDVTRSRVAEALLQGAMPDSELQFGDGWFQVRADAVGERLLWLLHDITEARALASEAQHLRELLDMAQEFGRLGVWERNLVTGEGRWDRHMFSFWGRDPQLGTPSHAEASQSVHAEDREALRIAEANREPGRYARHFRVIQPDGAVRRVHSQWEVKNDADGHPQRTIGVLVDDTEVYELARSLGDASAQLKLAVELADIAIWRHDLRTDRMHYNNRAFAVLGMPPRPEGVELAEVRALIHPDDMPAVVASARRALESDRPTDMQARYRRSDGSWRHVLTRRVVQRGPDGQALGFVGVALDVTEQYERQREASELALRLEIATSAAGMGVWTRDPITGVAEWNRKMFELCGRPPSQGAPTRDEWIGQIVHPDDRAFMLHARERMMSGPDGMVEHEYRIVRSDGQVRWLVNRSRREVWQERTMIFGVTLDVTERRHAEQALRSADERAALAARSAGIGTWESEQDGSNERWDEQMFRLRGLEPRAQPPSRDERLAMVVDSDRSATIDARPGALASRQPSRYEFRVRLPDGSIRWLASRSIPVLDERNQVIRRIGVNWDVTDAKNAELARQQTEVAERASQAKSQFLARMSHELRTPLNAVLGFAQLLQIEAGAAADEARRAKLGHIRSAGEHLLSLVNGVLDLSSLEAGNLKLDPQPLDLAELVEQALPLVGPLAQQHGVQLLRGEVSGLVVADRTRSLQVLVNLLTNAIKYNKPGGEVRIDAALAANTATLQVTDTGRGLSAEQQSHLFEPFNRLGMESKGIEGTGIGLTIVKALLAGMGGSISVQSREGVGSRFSVALPRLQGASAYGAAESPPPTLPQALPQRGGQLLYIEDNLVNVMLVEELVRSLSGLSIASETTGASGVARAAALRPDLVLIDMQLPDFDGFEVLRRLRAQPETAAIPCVALSANAMPEDIERARQAGFADYWTKPIDFKAFLGALDTLFPVRSLGEGI